MKSASCVAYCFLAAIPVSTVGDALAMARSFLPQDGMGTLLCD